MESAKHRLRERHYQAFLEGLSDADQAEVWDGVALNLAARQDDDLGHKD